MTKILNCHNQTITNKYNLYFTMTDIIYNDGIIYHASNRGRPDLTVVQIPDSVITIQGEAFQGCLKLKEVDIPDSVIHMGHSVFRDCSQLQSIQIPESIIKIRHMTFAYCSSLTQIEFPDNLTDIGLYAFAGCSSLTELKFPDSITYIGELAFQNCSGLRTVHISNSAISIDTNSFKHCSHQLTFIIPDKKLLTCKALSRFKKQLSFTTLAGDTYDVQIKSVPRNVCIEKFLLELVAKKMGEAPACIELVGTIIIFKDVGNNNEVN